MADYTTIDDPSEYFQVETYTGGGSNSTVTFSGNSNLQPDWLWIKRRNADYGHNVFDTTRGIAKLMEMDNVNAENTNQTWISSVGSDSFTIGVNEHNLSNSAGEYVAWAWKVNGGTTSSNTDGGINSTVQVNTTAGISIITFTTDGTTNTVGHGLGVKPDVVIYKSRSTGGGWLLITDKINGSMDYGYINSSDDFADIGYDANTSTLVQYNNNNGITNVAYCFKQIQGFSKFGAYYGNGQSTEGPFVYCGFKPAWVMIKNTQTDNRNWYIYDNKRRTFNPNGLKINADTAGQEATDQAIDMHSNGFRVRPGALGSYGTSNINHSSQYLFYMAFAENPFVSSEGTPTTAE